MHLIFPSLSRGGSGWGWVRLIRGTRSSPHLPKLLRPQGRDCRPRLRPLPQPVQGSGSRRGRTPDAEGYPCRSGQAGSGDSDGDGRVDSNARFGSAQYKFDRRTVIARIFYRLECVFAIVSQGNPDPERKFCHGPLGSGTTGHN